MNPERSQKAPKTRPDRCRVYATGGASMGVSFLKYWKPEQQNWTSERSEKPPKTRLDRFRVYSAGGTSMGVSVIKHSKYSHQNWIQTHPKKLRKNDQIGVVYIRLVAPVWVFHFLNTQNIHTKIEPRKIFLRKFEIRYKVLVFLLLRFPKSSQADKNRNS